jgi:hypothetical protein
VFSKQDRGINSRGEIYSRAFRKQCLELHIKPMAKITGSIPATYDISVPA